MGSRRTYHTINSMKKKNKKLLFQVSVIILPVFIVMTAAIARAMYNSTVSGFLDAQKAHMEYLLKSELVIQDYINQDQLEWYLTEWIGAPESLNKEYPDNYGGERWKSLMNEDDSFSRAWLDRMPDDLKGYCAYQQYNGFASYLEFAFDLNTYDSLIIMSAAENTEGRSDDDMNITMNKNGKTDRGSRGQARYADLSRA